MSVRAFFRIRGEVKDKQLTSIGDITQTARIEGTDEIFQQTKQRMSQVEQDYKKIRLERHPIISITKYHPYLSEKIQCGPFNWSSREHKHGVSLSLFYIR